jgi:hypothetical protein
MAEKFEIPPEVKAFVDLLHLDVVDKPMKLLPPGFKTPVWLIPVLDTGTEETVGILNAYPPYEKERYAIMTITNKLGRPVTVITFAEEAERMTAPTPKPEEVKEVVEAVEREVPEKVVSAPVDWSWMKAIASKMKTWTDALQRQAENRNAIACYTYLKSVNEWAEEARGKLIEASKLLESHEKRKPEPKVLKDEEYETLWKRFSEALSKAGLDPAKFRERFDELIAWDMPYSDNEYILMDEARRIMAESRLAKYIRKLPSKVPFNWKYIGWGIGSLKVDTGLLLDAVEEENAIQSYSTIMRIIDTGEKMKEILKSNPEVGFLS